MIQKEDHISLSQIGLYNPQRISDDVMEKLFIVRQSVFRFLMNRLNNEAPDSIPQHHLIIAPRGMGKTTLLKRIEVELRKNLAYQGYIPLLYPEEQYNVSNLAELWLNSLDAMADTLQVEKQTEIVNRIDKKVKELGQIKDDDVLAKQAFEYFQEMARELNRRPVLLIDNLNLVFHRLQKSEQHTLRSLLMQNKAPILIGASAISIEDTYDYKAPFYDAFQMHYLKKLSFEELLQILKQLAILTNAQELLPTIQEEIARLKTIHQLTGGNPRTAVMLFKLIVRGFSKDINDDLEALLDEITPLYKARFEELSPQNQKIVDVIALHWDPIHLEQLRNETRLENGQLSPQLKRLVEVGWIERTDAYQAKGSAYSISERFFNIWFLMRRSSRRQKREILCLSKFLESFYGDHLPTIAQRRLALQAQSLDHISYDLAMAMALKDGPLKTELEAKSYKELRTLAQTNPDIVKQFDLPEEALTGKAVEEMGKKTSFPDWYTINFKLTWETPEIHEKFLKELANKNGYAIVWYELGRLQHIELKKYREAQKAYLKVTESGEEIFKQWAYNNLGNLYADHLSEYGEAEKAYLKAIELDEKSSYPWVGLGNLYQVHLQKYEEAKKAYLKAIELDKKSSSPWNGLGYLYLQHLYKYEEAEKAYLRAIELNKSNASPWIGLGYLYQDHFQKYEEAEKAYLKAIELGEENIAKYNLVFLYRDSLNRREEAEALFNELPLDNETEDSYWLNKTLFELYDKNEGIAGDMLGKALDYLQGELRPLTRDDWYRFAAVATRLGYGPWLLGILERRGFDVVVAPYFIAIRAINEPDQEAYLNSKAIELSAPARKIIEIMRRYA